MEVCSAVGSAVSVVWGGHPVERERVQEAMGEVFLGRFGASLNNKINSII